MNPITLEMIEALAKAVRDQANLVHDIAHDLQKRSEGEDYEAEDSLKLTMFGLTLAVDKLKGVFQTELVRMRK